MHDCDPAISSGGTIIHPKVYVYYIYSVKMRRTNSFPGYVFLTLILCILNVYLHFSVTHLKKRNEQNVDNLYKVNVAKLQKFQFNCCID